MHACMHTYIHTYIQTYRSIPAPRPGGADGCEIQGREAEARRQRLQGLALFGSQTFPKIRSEGFRVWGLGV